MARHAQLIVVEHTGRMMKEKLFVFTSSLILAAFIPRL
jgi:hypothetical protein